MHRPTTGPIDTPLRSAWRFAGFGWVLLVVYLSLAPHPPGEGVLPMDAGHFVAYAWLMLWFGQLCAKSRDRVLTATALVALGILLELAQGLTPLRDLSPIDMVLDTAGVAAGAALLRTRLASALDALDAAVKARAWQRGVAKRRRG